MPLSDDHKAAIRASNRRRAASCKKCGSESLGALMDGFEVGGLPGIKYTTCHACGDCRPVKGRRP